MHVSQLIVFAGGLFDEQFLSGSMSQMTKNMFRYAVWRVNQQPRGRKFAYDIQTIPVDNSFETAKKGLKLIGLILQTQPGIWIGGGKKRSAERCSDREAEWRVVCLKSNNNKNCTLHCNVSLISVNAVFLSCNFTPCHHFWSSFSCLSSSVNPSSHQAIAVHLSELTIALTADV